MQSLVGRSLLTTVTSIGYENPIRSMSSSARPALSILRLQGECMKPVTILSLAFAVWALLPGATRADIQVGLGLGASEFVAGYPIPVLLCIDNVGAEPLRLPLAITTGTLDFDLQKEGVPVARRWGAALPSGAAGQVENDAVIEPGRSRFVGVLLAEHFPVDVAGSHVLRVALSIPSEAQYADQGAGAPTGWTGTVWSNAVTFDVVAPTGVDVAAFDALRRGGAVPHVPTTAYSVEMVFDPTPLAGTSYEDAVHVGRIASAVGGHGGGIYLLEVALGAASDVRHRALLAALLAGELLLPDPHHLEDGDEQRARDLVSAVPTGALFPCDPIARLRLELGVQ